MVGVLRCGASGYVRKDADPELLVAAVRAVARGGILCRPFRRRAAHQPRGPTHRPRTRCPCARWALGRGNKEIADSLHIGDETVKTHVSNVLAKLGAENRAQAIVQALKRGVRPAR